MLPAGRGQALARNKKTLHSRAILLYALLDQDEGSQEGWSEGNPRTEDRWGLAPGRVPGGQLSGPPDDGGWQELEVLCHTLHLHGGDVLLWVLLSLLSFLYLALHPDWDDLASDQSNPCEPVPDPSFRDDGSLDKEVLCDLCTLPTPSKCASRKVNSSHGRARALLYLPSTGRVQRDSFQH